MKRQTGRGIARAFGGGSALFEFSLLVQLFVCWFVRRITQRPLNRFPPNSAGGWGLGLGRRPLHLGADDD